MTLVLSCSSRPPLVALFPSWKFRPASAELRATACPSRRARPARCDCSLWCFRAPTLPTRGCATDAGDASGAICLIDRSPVTSRSRCPIFACCVNDVFGRTASRSTTGSPPSSSAAADQWWRFRCAMSPTSPTWGSS